MDDHQVYLEKITAFSRILRIQGLSASPQETADACRVLTDIGFDNRPLVKQALSAIYAKSREEQLIFDRFFDGFFISEEAMRQQAKEQAAKEAEMDAIRKESLEDLQINGQPMMLSQEQRNAYASMSQQERQKLLDFLERYKVSAERNPNLYGNFIHSVFTKSLLEQQMRMEDAAMSAAAADPEIGLLFRDISDFQDKEIPKAISIIQTIAQQINAEISAKKKSSGHSGKLDFRRTIRKGLETGGTFYRLKYKKRPSRRKHMVLQMQFNKPKETGDYADLAKMSAGMEMARRISMGRKNPAPIFRETRTGIESLSADMDLAKWQLARSTFLQMCMDPHIIHIVSYCEANYAARPADIIDSSRLIRRAVRIFRQNKEDIMKEVNVPLVKERRDWLIKESTYLLEQIAKLHPQYKPCPLEAMAFYLGNEDVIASSIEQKLMTAPGIINAKYKGDFLTKPMKYGMINVVDNYEQPRILCEKERLYNLNL